jgi:hypothetical protein
MVEQSVAAFRAGLPRPALNLNPAAVLIWAKDLGPPCNCGVRFRRAQAELAGSADDHAGTDADLMSVSRPEGVTRPVMCR